MSNISRVFKVGRQATNPLSRLIKGKKSFSISNDKTSHNLEFINNRFTGEKTIEVTSTPIEHPKDRNFNDIAEAYKIGQYITALNPNVEKNTSDFLRNPNKDMMEQLFKIQNPCAQGNYCSSKS